MDDLDEIVQSSVNAEIESLLDEQTKWEHPTDCDRLELAFRDLNSTGILAQHHYTCCRNCGDFEIRLHMQHEVQQGRTCRGFTYYHVQDTERAVEGQGLFLAYGDSREEGSDGEEEASIAVGHHVCDILRQHGLKPIWNDDIEKRIVVPLDWKRPWPPKVSDVVPDAALEMYSASVVKKNEPAGFWARLRKVFGKR